MDKRFIVFIIISVAVLYFSNYYTMQRAKEKGPKVTYSEEKTQEQKSIKEEVTVKAKTQSKADPDQEKTIQFSNEELNVMASNLGGVISTLTLKAETKEKSEEIKFIYPGEINTNFLFECEINNEEANLYEKLWEINNTNKGINFIYSGQNEVQISKKINFDIDHTAEIEIEISNLGSETKEISNPRLFWHIAKDLQNAANIKQLVVYTKAKTHRFKSKKKNETQLIQTEPIWAGMKDQYFCSIFYGADPKIETVKIQHFDNQSMQMEINFTKLDLQPGETKSIKLKGYFGPQDYVELKKRGAQIHRIVHFGFFHFIGVPIYYTLRYFYALTNNYGFAIILLTLLIRIILWWPTQKSYSSMKKMQTAMNKMQPRLKTLKEIYKNDAAKLNEETMKLYKEYQINPMGGCLPMLLQMPVFFALYSTLVSAVELKGAEFIWFWKDLSSKDPYYVLPLLMGITMFIQQKISTPPAATPEAAAQQKMMLYFMPAMLTFFSFVWPSGLLLYWVVSNVLSIGQQIMINQRR